MNLKRILLGVLLLIVGIFGVYVGEIDDSPGASGIGIIIIILGVYFIVKSFLKKSKK